MKRRQFITLLGGAAAWPLAARAQPERMRRIGVLASLAEDDPEMMARLAGFRQGLQKRGWSEGRNVSIDARFAPNSSADQVQVLAKELIALQPDVILGTIDAGRRRTPAGEPRVLTASCAATNPPTFRCRRRPSSKRPLTSKRRRRSA